jgi:hypothetical protein
MYREEIKRWGVVVALIAGRFANDPFIEYILNKIRPD